MSTVAVVVRESSTGGASASVVVEDSEPVPVPVPVPVRRRRRGKEGRDGNRLRLVAPTGGKEVVVVLFSDPASDVAVCSESVDSVEARDRREELLIEEFPTVDEGWCSSAKEATEGAAVVPTPPPKGIISVMILLNKKVTKVNETLWTGYRDRESMTISWISCEVAWTLPFSDTLSRCSTSDQVSAEIMPSLSD